MQATPPPLSQPTRQRTLHSFSRPQYPRECPTATNSGSWPMEPRSSGSPTGLSNSSPSPQARTAPASSRSFSNRIPPHQAAPGPRRSVLKSEAPNLSARPADLQIFRLVTGADPPPPTAAAAGDILVSG